MKCPNCGIETNEKICPNCGANFDKTINKIKCPNCGIETTEKICPNCGADFTKMKKDGTDKPENNSSVKAETEAKKGTEPKEEETGPKEYFTKDSKYKDGVRCEKCGTIAYGPLCPTCGSRIPEPTSLEKFLNYSPGFRPQKPSSFSSEMKKPVWKREWPTWAKVLTVIVGVAIVILAIVLISDGAYNIGYSSNDKENVEADGRRTE